MSQYNTESEPDDYRANNVFNQALRSFSDGVCNDDDN